MAARKLLPFSSQSSLDQMSLGLKGGMRMAQTLGKVYPQALKLLFGWRKPTAKEVRQLFESLGVTYIKFGQLIASSPSIFPKDYVDEFQTCLDQTAAVPFYQIREIVEADLGRPLSQIYSSFDYKPLASASIAQVHAATLISGEDVVVKVQKPGVETIVTTDMNAVFLMTRVMEIIVPKMDKDSISGLVSELYQAMIDECDFEKEANNLIEFDAFLTRTENPYVIVPKPYPKATSKRVLTMERFYGVALTSSNALKQCKSDPAASLFNALNTWFASLEQCAFFHADLHSGNILLLDDGRVGFIDFGMVGRMPSSSWQAMTDFFAAISSQDYKLMAESMVAVGMTKTNVNIAALAGDIRNLFAPQFEQMNTYNEANDDVEKLLSELGAVASRYGIRFPRAFTLVVKQFLYFDRYMQILAPGHNVFNDDRIDLLQ
jgi:predicted unusual protein kinase regulating ubiquinone biosynthesis (AarF/ABC1/UbiB family)